MPQGKFKKALRKKARKGSGGYPVAAIAFYGPDNTRATKVVCSIFESEGAEPKSIRKWFAENDVMKSEEILGQVLSFIEDGSVVTVAMAESIMGCPHEEGVDYPKGEPCPECPFWKNRDRFTHELFH